MDNGTAATGVDQECRITIEERRPDDDWETGGALWNELRKLWE